MKNYSVIDESNRTRFEGTIQQCFEEVRHAAPFRIINNTTGLTVLVRVMNGFRPAKRFFNQWFEKCCKLEDSRKFFVL